LSAVAWSHVAGSTTQDYVSALAVDRAGNVYLTGMVGPNVDFGGGPLAGSGGYVVSYSSRGDYRWGRILKGSAWADTLTVTPAGEVFVAGLFKGPLELDGTIRKPSGPFSAYLVALSPAGKYLWARSFGDGEFTTASGLALTPDGGVVLAGSYLASADFGGGKRAGGRWQRLYVVSYSLEGAYRWDVVGPATSVQISHGVAVDGNGNVTVVGHFSGEFDVGGGTRKARNSSSGFVASFDHAGKYRWDWANPAEANAPGHAVAVDSGGGAYVTGEFVGTIEFAGASLSARDLSSYVLAFDATGAERWARSYSGSGAVRAYGIALGPADSLFLTGYFDHAASFGTTSLKSTDGHDVFAVALSTWGAELSGRSFGGPGDEEGNAIVASCDGHVYVGGRDPGHDTSGLVSMDALVVAFE